MERTLGMSLPGGRIPGGEYLEGRRGEEERKGGRDEWSAIREEEDNNLTFNLVYISR